MTKWSWNGNSHIAIAYTCTYKLYLNLCVKKGIKKMQAEKMKRKIYLPDIPVYKWKLSMYPLVASARSQTLIPNLVDFAGMYCLKPSHPLSAIVASSITKFWCNVYCSLIVRWMIFRMGQTWWSVSYPSSPLAWLVVESFKPGKEIAINNKRS